jgi:hypothetical protein
MPETGAGWSLHPVCIAGWRNQPVLQLPPLAVVEYDAMPKGLDHSISPEEAVLRQVHCRIVEKRSDAKKGSIACRQHGPSVVSNQ